MKVQSLQNLAQQKGLPELYVEEFEELIIPLVDSWLNEYAQTEIPQIWGVQGCQGSGKSTLSEFIKRYVRDNSEIKIEICSIDDFYLTKAERYALAQRVHPLLGTRGVPGTHDVGLMNSAFEQFQRRKLHLVPSFNKAIDDRNPQHKWHAWDTSPDILIFEGWCVGIQPQAENQLDHAINELEETQDRNGEWRRFVNLQLHENYSPLFSKFDRLLSIQAPSFECVYDWRLQQEEELISRLRAQGKSVVATMSPPQIKQFISHYQRLTQHGFDTMGNHADAVLTLNLDHSFAGMRAA